MPRTVIYFAGLLAAGLLAGCDNTPEAPGDALPVSGVVTINGDPAEHVLVTFEPTGETGGFGGSGMTDAAGKYEVTSSKGYKGLEPGTYKVVANRRLNPDGTPPPPDVEVMDSQATETLPPFYSDPMKTKLTMTVAESGDYNLDLKAKK